MFTDANEDQSLIVEFVVCAVFHFAPFLFTSAHVYQQHKRMQEYANQVQNQEAGEFFFQDLAATNGAAFATVSSITEVRSDAVPHLPPNTFTVIVQGQQSVGKSRQQEVEKLNKIQIIMLIVRLPHHHTDMLITLNSPIFISAQSAAAEQAGAGYKQGHVEAPELFRRIIATLKIIDWNLFSAGADIAQEEP